MDNINSILDSKDKFISYHNFNSKKIDDLTKKIMERWKLNQSYNELSEICNKLKKENNHYYIILNLINYIENELSILSSCKLCKLRNSNRKLENDKAKVIQLNWRIFNKFKKLKKDKGIIIFNFIKKFFPIYKNRSKNASIIQKTWKMFKKNKRKIEKKKRKKIKSKLKSLNNKLNKKIIKFYFIKFFKKLKTL